MKESLLKSNILQEQEVCTLDHFLDFSKERVYEHMWMIILVAYYISSTGNTLSVIWPHKTDKSTSQNSLNTASSAAALAFRILDDDADTPKQETRTNLTIPPCSLAICTHFCLLNIVHMDYRRTKIVLLSLFFKKGQLSHQFDSY